MSDEPLNHKLLAKNKHRSGNRSDKNTSRGKYKADEYELKKKQREEFARREQDPNYQQKSNDNDEEGSNENGSGDGSDDDDDDDSIKFNHSRSKYSKRILLQNDKSKLVNLDEKYYNQASLLNMQSLIDSKVDFIPKFDNLNIDNIFDNNENNNNVNKKNNNNDNSINSNEIEKLLSSFTLEKRLNIDKHYLNGVKLPNPSNITHLKRKSNKHLTLAAESSNTSNIKSPPPPPVQSTIIQKSSSPSSITSPSIDSFNSSPSSSSSILSPLPTNKQDKPTTTTTPIDNGNVTSDNLEDWLDSII